MTVTGLTEATDVLPTILDLCSISIPRGFYREPYSRLHLTETPRTARPVQSPNHHPVHRSGQSCILTDHCHLMIQKMLFTQQPKRLEWAY
mgnify:CR=1 FL=1